MDEEQRRGTVHAMAYDRARDLDATLAVYQHVSGLIEHVRSACGADPASVIDGQVPVLGFHLAVTDEVFAVYALTDTGFVVAEMNGAGVTFALFVPRERIRRVAEFNDGDRCTVTVEIDADVVRYTEQHEPAGSSTAVVGVASCVRYDLVGARGDSELSWLARQLRR